MEFGLCYDQTAKKTPGCWGQWCLSHDSHPCKVQRRNKGKNWGSSEQASEVFGSTDWDGTMPGLKMNWGEQRLYYDTITLLKEPEEGTLCHVLDERRGAGCFCFLENSSKILHGFRLSQNFMLWKANCWDQDSVEAVASVTRLIVLRVDGYCSVWRLNTLTPENLWRTRTWWKSVQFKITAVCLKSPHKSFYFQIYLEHCANICYFYRISRKWND